MSYSNSHLKRALLLFILQIILSNLVNFGPLLFISIYPLFLITLPLSISRKSLMIWAFSIGFAVDLFSNSILGLNSAASVMMVAFQPWSFKLLYRKGEMEKQSRVGLYEMTLPRFLPYLIISLTIHHITLTALESFGFTLFLHNLPRVLVSLITNTILIVIVEFGFFYKRRR